MNDFIIDQDRSLYRDRLYSKAINNEEASLQHYGVLGMKWGVRKAKDTGGSGKKRKGKNSKNSNKSKAEKTKNALKTAGKIALGVAGVAGAALAGKAIYDNRDDIMNMGMSALTALGAKNASNSTAKESGLGLGRPKFQYGIGEAAKRHSGGTNWQAFDNGLGTHSGNLAITNASNSTAKESGLGLGRPKFQYGIGEAAKRHSGGTNWQAFDNR